MFDISQFDRYREDNRREVKKVKGGLPISLWDTINNVTKVSVNLLSDDNVKTYKVGNDAVMVITVPPESRE